MYKLIVVVLIALLSGCAVFPGDKVPKITLSSYDGNAENKPTISYAYTAMGGLSTITRLPDSTQSIMEGELVSAMQGSEYFSRVSKVDDSADIQMSVTMTNSGNPAAIIPAVITGLSLYTIPSWATDNYNLVVNVEKTGGLKKQYVLADSTVVVQWLPMMFVFPAKNFSAIPELRKNMYRKVLSDMKNDGFFNQ